MDCMNTAWKVSKYGVFSVFSPNVGKYRTEKTPYFDTFQAVVTSVIFISMIIFVKPFL